MTQLLILTLLSCVAMALTQAAIGAFFPSTHRPWWHPLQRAGRPAARSDAGMHSSELPTLPVSADDLPAAPVAPTALQVVETHDRRSQSLPFVGRDRRLVAQVKAAETTRRTGTRD
ncbi:hypothetical protein [Leptothrix discophora]|uniref:Uncharacterized protein n=1 Tax=Leptothrix discophora TaxID=89 RepID=A0ABT9G7K5_LEPDI|nr:hypothetical protein [Leptothrix discophora]MDP4302464.1 hypothetical protein [Leptothrix discophora]